MITVKPSPLYLIEILHQTTTEGYVQYTGNGCILSKFYIKPQRRIASVLLIRCCILSKFYIKPQPEMHCCLQQRCCILSKFYIKPQQKQVMRFSASCCILSKFYIKPQQEAIVLGAGYSCILSKFYIKPQQRWPLRIYSPVVSYRNSTSNHNSTRTTTRTSKVVSYRNSTSNHNEQLTLEYSKTLYLIEILHQTTTTGRTLNGFDGCILSKFYIKPQRCMIST